MPFPNAVFMVFIFVPYATEIMGEISSGASRFKSAVRSINQQWFPEGVQFFAYSYTRHYWLKRTLKWAITDSPSHVSAQDVEEAMTEAFQKWAAPTPFTFEKVLPGDEVLVQQLDIRVSFKPMEQSFISHTILPQEPELDNYGVTIIFGDTTNWTDLNDEYWCNFRFAALHEIGHALALGDSKDRGAVMYEGNLGFELVNSDPVLNEDDIYGIQKLYGDCDGQSPPSNGTEPSS